MSRVGKAPIPIPSGVTVNVNNNLISVKGAKGELSTALPPEIIVQVEEQSIKVLRPTESQYHRSLHGLSRTLVANMVHGVSEGFMKRLEIVGVGYRAELKGKALHLAVGFSHPIIFIPPDGVQLTVEGNTNIVVKGIDKELVGKVAAKIRSLKPPEPYKGKGIRYSGEIVRKKAGKTAAK